MRKEAKYIGYAEEKPASPPQLLQAGPALFAHTQIDVCAHFFLTGRAPPVHGGIGQKSGNARDLRPEQLALREISEDPGTFVQHGAQANQEQGYRDCDKLAALARMKFPQYAFLIFSMRHDTSPIIRNSHGSVFCLLSSVFCLLSSVFCSYIIRSIF
jgi:hypothetical protein